MRPNHQSIGGFLRSSAFSFIIIGNLLFSLVFVLSLSFHIVKPKERAEPVSVEKEPQPKSQSMVTLANIQQ